MSSTVEGGFLPGLDARSWNVRGPTLARDGRDEDEVELSSEEVEAGEDKVDEVGE